MISQADAGRHKAIKNAISMIKRGPKTKRQADDDDMSFKYIRKDVEKGPVRQQRQKKVLYDFLVTVNAAPHECVRTGQP